MKRRKTRHEDLSPECQAHVREFSEWVDALGEPSMRIWVCGAAVLDEFLPWWLAMILTVLLLGVGTSWGTIRWVRDNPLPPTWPGRDG